MIYVFLAEGFEEIEAVTTIDILRRANCDVKTVGISSKLVKGTNNIVIDTDTTIQEINKTDIDMIILPGGMPGTINLENSDIVKDCINYCVENEKYIAAICAAPSILGHMGILKGKKAVCYPGFEKDLKEAEIIKDNVCIDKNIITANGPGSSMNFALILVELILGKNISEKIKESLKCVQ